MRAALPLLVAAALVGGCPTNVTDFDAGTADAGPQHDERECTEDFQCRAADIAGDPCTSNDDCDSGVTICVLTTHNDGRCIIPHGDPSPCDDDPDRPFKEHAPGPNGLGATQFCSNINLECRDNSCVDIRDL
jgi:hypothetical protein